jgi:hypothetical protein
MWASMSEHCDFLYIVSSKWTLVLYHVSVFPYNLCYLKSFVKVYWRTFFPSTDHVWWVIAPHKVTVALKCVKFSHNLVHHSGHKFFQNHLCLEIFTCGFLFPTKQLLELVLLWHIPFNHIHTCIRGPIIKIYFTRWFPFMNALYL